MDLIVDILSWILKGITLYTTIVGLCFLLPRQKYPKAAPHTRFAVLVAARNEENVIGELVGSLLRQNYPGDHYDIFVIPNNCSDDTEGAARRAGAKILPCLGEVHGKGDVLNQAFRQLMGKYDAYCVFDADNIVHPDFLARMNDAIASGARAAKGRQMASNPYENWVSGGYDLYIESYNLMQNRAKSALRLSAKLVGTGFMVTDRLMQQLGGWNTSTITEDAELAAQCALRGVRIHYVLEAVTYDEQPTSFRISMRQRYRWSAGVQSVANRYVPRLLAKPRWLTWDQAANLSMIYVQLLALLPTLYALIGLRPMTILTTLAVALLSFWLSMTATGLFLCVTARRNPLKMWKGILMYPVFTASWYPLHFISLFKKPKRWTPIPHGARRSGVGIK